MIDKMNTLELRCTIDEDQSLCEINRIVKGRKQFVTELFADFMEPKKWYDIHVTMKMNKFKVYIKNNKCMEKKYVRHLKEGMDMQKMQTEEINSDGYPSKINNKSPKSDSDQTELPCQEEFDLGLKHNSSFKITDVDEEPEPGQQKGILEEIDFQF